MTCGAGGAREHLQRHRRPLPLPEQPAGVLAIQHLDPRPGLDPCGYAEQLEFVGRSATAARPLGGRAAGAAVEMLRAALRGRRLLPGKHPDLRHPVLGHRCARPGAPRRLPPAAGGPVQRPRAGRQLGGGDRRPGPAAARPVPVDATGTGGRHGDDGDDDGGGGDGGPAAMATAARYWRAGLAVAAPCCGSPT